MCTQLQEQYYCNCVHIAKWIQEYPLPNVLYSRQFSPGENFSPILPPVLIDKIFILDHNFFVLC